MRHLISDILLRDERMHQCLETGDRRRHLPENIHIVQTQQIIEQMISNTYISIEQFGTLLKFLVTIVQDFDQRIVATRFEMMEYQAKYASKKNKYTKLHNQMVTFNRGKYQAKKQIQAIVDYKNDKTKEVIAQAGTDLQEKYYK